MSTEIKITLRFDRIEAVLQTAEMLDEAFELFKEDSSKLPPGEDKQQLEAHALQAAVLHACFIAQLQRAEQAERTAAQNALEGLCEFLIEDDLRFALSDLDLRELIALVKQQLNAKHNEN